MALRLVVFVGTGALLRAILGGQDSAEDRVNEYLTGTAEREFFASDAQFRATFPSFPERSTEEADVGGRKIEVTFYVSRVKEGEFGVAVFDIAPGETFDLNASANGSAAGVNGRVESSALTKVQGIEAVEFVVSASDSKFVKAVTLRAPTRVYQVIVVGPENPPEGYEKFKQSFQVAP